MGLPILFLLFLFLSSRVSAEDLTWSTHVFPSGFTLVTKEMHGHPSCSVHLFVGVGSVNENPRINGISHFYEHLFFKGTPRRSSTQMKSEIESYGGDLNGATYRDYTQFIINIPGAYADKAIDLLLDAFFNATLDPEELEKERKVVLDEVNLDASNPQRRLTEAFQKLVYTLHPYRLPIAGTQDSVRRITRDDVLGWKNKYYVQGNAALVVIGDVSTKKVEDQVADWLSQIPSSGKFLHSVLPDEPARAHPVVQRTNEQVEQSLLVLGYKVAGLNSPEDIYPLDVLTFMLGYGRSSLLTRELKDKLHLVSSVGADFLTQRYPSTLEVEVVCKPESVEECRRKILDIFRRIRNGDVDSREVERAKTLLEGVYTLGNQTNSGKVSTIGFYLIAGSPEFATDYLSRIRQVTVQDIARVAKKYLQDNYAEVDFLPGRSRSPESSSIPLP